MARANPRPDYLRARSESEKSDRRQAILAAAAAHAREAGFDGFSMAVLARRAGIAKGTLYLYFETREEVLLSLYTQQLTAFAATLGARLDEIAAKAAGDREFAVAFLEAARAEATFLDLSARLGSVIEHNVSMARLIESKRTMRALLVPLSLRLERSLALAPGSGAPLLAATMALLLGASQVDAGPSLDGEDVPDDILAMTRAFGCDELFLANAPLLVAGYRAASPGAA